MCLKLGQANVPPPQLKGKVTIDEIKISKQEILRVMQKKPFAKEVMQLAEADLNGSEQIQFDLQSTQL